LDLDGVEIANARGPPLAPANEGQELFQIPSVGLHASRCLAALLALKGAELLHQLDELLSHCLGLSGPSHGHVFAGEQYWVVRASRQA
jgi:hypothetical protein